MVLRIEGERAEQLARDLAELTGESIADAVVASLEARLGVERRRALGLGDIVERFSRLRVLDERDPDGDIGDDEHGLPV